MAVPIALGKTFFDPTDLKNEFNRLTRTLLNPSPRMARDPAETLFFSIRDNTTGEVLARYDLYTKAFYDKAGDPPTLRLFYKDGTNTERLYNDNGASDAIAEAEALAVSTGNRQDVYVGGVLHYDTTSNGSMSAEAIDVMTGNITVDGTLVGQIHYEAVSGLDLAVTNTRITEVNTALDGLTKILTVLNGNIDAGISLIR